MRYLYSLIWVLLMPLLVLRLLWRGLRAPSYWRGWGYRFAWQRPHRSYDIWIHAVSVGEVQASLPLIAALKQQFPTYSLLVTTFTPTGAAQLRQHYPDLDQQFLPYDLPWAVGAFIRKIQPKLGIIMETELWPNLLFACQRAAVPLVLANARLSARSFRAYQRYHFGLLAPTLDALSHIAAQTAADASHFQRLGVDPQRLTVTGNIKFDSELPSSLHEQAAALKRQWANRLVWIAASTHEGEEEQILSVFQRLLVDYADLLLILVPRHPERFKRVAQLCRAAHPTVCRSEGGACEAETAIYVGDTMGELPLLYASADVAFVGGSLVEIGGHNMLEPAALGVPSVFGQYVFNFALIAAQLQQHEAALQVGDVEALYQVLRRYLADPNLRHQTGENAQQFVAQNRGALQKLQQIVLIYLNKQHN